MALHIVYTLKIDTGDVGWSASVEDMRPSLSIYVNPITSRSKRLYYVKYSESLSQYRCDSFSEAFRVS